MFFSQNLLISLSLTLIENPVASLTASKVVSSAISINYNFPLILLNTANSVITVSTNPFPVRGKLQSDNNL